VKKILLLLLAAVLLGGGAYAWYAYGSGNAKMPFRTEAVKRGELLATISATGTLEPEDVIDVGAQVAGQIKEFGTDPKTSKPIDYGSEVEAGTVLARIDDALYQAKVDQSRARVNSAVAKVDQAKANVQRAEADLAQNRARVDPARRDWDRARNLGPTGAVSAQDYDNAKMTYETSVAAVGVSEAALTQAKSAVTDAQATVGDAKAQLAQDEVNLGYCTIKSPVKGVIIDRRVTMGQTVQSSFNTPSLFLIAKDLKRMTVWASVNEADIGQVRVGQPVTFTVDAYPGETFKGTVSRIRLNATMTQNVVTFTVEVTTDNSAGRLLPYVTANLHFEVNRKDNALLTSNAALRWKPQANQVVPEERAAYVKSMRGKDVEGGTPEPANQATVWVLEDEFVRPIPVKLGLSDGNVTEVVGGDLTEGTKVVTGESSRVGGEDTNNPFAPKIFGGGKKGS
jgi:HlyD family secretion protein